MAPSDVFSVLHIDSREEVPPRTQLFRLEPKGLGTAGRESLSSFTMRLAHEHSVSPTCLASLVRYGIGSVAGGCAGDWNQPRISGASVSARVWTAALATLTGHGQLRALTMLSLGTAISSVGLMASRRRWCPECLASSHTSYLPYGRLIWELAVVEACPEHKLVLADRCSCGIALRKGRRIAQLPHICGGCGLSLSGTTVRTVATSSQCRSARLVAALLAHPMFDRGGWPKPYDGTGKFLRSASGLHFNGEPAKLARALGLSKGAFHGWCSAAHRPAFSTLVKLADLLGSTLSDVLDGDASGTHPPTGRLPPARPTGRSLSPSERHRRIAERLKALGRKSPPLSLSAASRIIGVSGRLLYKRHGKTARTFSRRFLAYRKSRALERERRTARTLGEMIAGGATRASIRELKAGTPLRFKIFNRLVDEALAAASARRNRER
jgi:hypothetical protein